MGLTEAGYGQKLVWEDVSVSSRNAQVRSEIGQVLKKRFLIGGDCKVSKRATPGQKM